MPLGKPFVPPSQDRVALGLVVRSIAYKVLCTVGSVGVPGRCNGAANRGQ